MQSLTRSLTKPALRRALAGALLPLLTHQALAQEEESAAADDTASVLSYSADDVSLTFSGALWVNYANQSWLSPDEGKKRGMRFDNLRLALDGTYRDDIFFSVQYRIYGYTQALHHGYFGYRPSDADTIDLGITQVPFGLLPFATHSFWFGLGYNLGMEDEYDAGIKWHHDGGPWQMHLAYFANDEYGDATSLDRYSVDLVRDGDQQNEEAGQLNARFSYDFGAGGESTTEVGFSAQFGEMDNLTTQQQGDRWQTAVHYRGRYGDWNPEVQLARYEYDPANPVGVDDRLVLFGNLASKRLVAAEGTLLNLNLRRFWEVEGDKLLDRFNVYLNYSHHDKDEESFLDSDLINPGALLEFGPLWIWVDALWGKNAQYLNDSEANSGPGAGGTDEYEFRFNVSFEWFF